MAKPDSNRQCALTREVKAAADLVRFAVSPEGAVVPDIDARARGRGVWITLSREAVAKAQQRNVFARSLKQPVELPPDLAHMVAVRLEQRLLGALGLARKAGQFLTGAMKVKTALASGNVAALFTASDAAPDGRRKMLAALNAGPTGVAVPHFEFLTSEQLGLALGLQNVIHAALIEGPAAKSALFRAGQLARYEDIDPADRDGPGTAELVTKQS